MTFRLKQKQWLTVLLAALLSVVLTLVLYLGVRRAREVLRDRMIILAYQTNINGSDGEAWAHYLEETYPEAPGFEVAVYLLQQAGNESITITASDGWQQIVTRLAARQGDILLVNNKIFYETLLQGGYLLPLDGDYSNAVRDDAGRAYGLDITGMTAEGLLNLNTSTLVGKGQPLPITSVDENAYEKDGNTIGPRVIAVVYKGSAHAEQAKAYLGQWFGENGHA